MKTILTLLLIMGMSFSSTLNAMAAPGEERSERVARMTFVNNSDCKGDRDDDCR